MGKYSVGKRCSAEILMITPPGMLLISSVRDLMMNSAGDRKNFAGDDLSVATC